MVKEIARKKFRGRVHVLLEKDGKFYVGNTKKKSARTLSGAAELVTHRATSGRYFWNLLDKVPAKRRKRHS